MYFKSNIILPWKQRVKFGKLLLQPVDSWSVRVVAEFLLANNFHELALLFLANGVDGNTLLNIVNDLADINSHIGAALKVIPLLLGTGLLLRSIAYWQQSGFLEEVTR